MTVKKIDKKSKQDKLSREEFFQDEEDKQSNKIDPLK